jgi:pyrophosphatase PpaX
MLKAVLFDVDGVLVDSKEAVIAFYLSLFKQAGYGGVTREEVAKCFHLPLVLAIKKLTNGDEQEVDRIRAMAVTSEHRTKELYKFPDKLDHVLESLHKRFKLAIVTSRIRYGVQHVFDAKEMEHFFDVVVAFEDYSKPKPDPEPLRVALERLGVSSDEAIYIGDSDTDIEAATAAGMPSIHLATKHHKDATHGIERFEELLDVIELISTR